MYKAKSKWQLTSFFFLQTIYTDIIQCDNLQLFTPKIVVHMQQLIFWMIYTETGNVQSQFKENIYIRIVYEHHPLRKFV